MCYHIKKLLYAFAYLFKLKRKSVPEHLNISINRLRQPLSFGGRNAQMRYTDIIKSHLEYAQQVFVQKALRNLIIR